LDIFLQVLIGGIGVGLIYALPAFSIVLLFNTAGFPNLAQGDFLALSTYFLLQFHILMSLPLPLAILFTIVAMGTVGILVNTILFNPLRKFNALPQLTLIVTLALSIFLQNFIRVVWGSTPLAVNIFPAQPVVVGGAFIRISSFWILGASVILILLIYILSQKTAFGMAMRAASEDKEAANLMGINVNMVIGAAFAISLTITGIAGILGTSVLFLTPEMGISIGTKAFAAAVIGGFGNPIGALFGGVLIGVLESYVSLFLPASYRDVITFLLLICFLLFKPTGLFKTENVTKV